MAIDSEGDQQPRPMLHLPSDEEIIATCARQSAVDSSGYMSRYAMYPSPEAPLMFIKYGYEDDGMLAEARNQEFAYEALQKMPHQDTTGIQIARIYRIISKDEIVYIVMEYVRGKTIKELLDEDPDNASIQECYDQVTKAIQVFLSIPVSTVIPGPVGGGIIRHPIFKMAIASVRYRSVADLQNHLNAVFIW